MGENQNRVINVAETFVLAASCSTNIRRSKSDYSNGRVCEHW